MELKLNKPRVFLSHSKADVSFVEQVYDDLRKCQIDPWLDSAEIRHGKPWLDAIFEDGIPTCDAVIVYFTEISLESRMVKKEMDAGILQQLKDKRVAFLPYVDDEGRRTKLRADIQALQVPVWNPENYKDIMPQVVAEIWRSYLERMIAYAVQDERVKRLEAELELEKIKKESSGSIFNSTEDAEFTYLWETFNKWVPIEVEEKTRDIDKLGKSGLLIPVRKYKVEVKLSTVISLLFSGERVEFNQSIYENFLSNQAKAHLSKLFRGDGSQSYYVVKKSPYLIDDLMMYGFIELIYESPTENLRPFRSLPHYRYISSYKCYRFRYWLAFNKRLPTSVVFGENIEIADVVTPKT